MHWICLTYATRSAHCPICTYLLICMFGNSCNVAVGALLQQCEPSEFYHLGSQHAPIVDDPTTLRSLMMPWRRHLVSSMYLLLMAKFYRTTLGFEAFVRGQGTASSNRRCLTQQMQTLRFVQVVFLALLVRSVPFSACSTRRLPRDRLTAPRVALLASRSTAPIVRTLGVVPFWFATCTNCR